MGMANRKPLRTDRLRIEACGLVLASLCAACGGGEEPATAPAAPQVDAHALLSSGDADGAFAAWEASHAANPQDVPAAVGASYAALVRGDYAEADRILASVESVSGSEIGPIRARRALIALEAGKRDQVLEYGKSSGTVEGQILAAEAALCRSDWEDAQVLLEPIAGVGGPVGESASIYLDRLSQEDMTWSMLAEAEACWGMGLYGSAVEAAAEVFPDLPDSWERLGEEALVWSTRALRERDVESAEALLKPAGKVGPMNTWRLAATKALVDCAKGNAERCVSGLNRLDADAPPRGVSDSKAFGAYLLGADHRESALAMLGEDQTSAAAYAAYTVGDAATAARLAPDPFLQSVLGGR